MKEKCSHYKQFHTGTCGTRQVFLLLTDWSCQKILSMLSGSGLVEQFSSQPQVPI